MIFMVLKNFLRRESRRDGFSLCIVVSKVNVLTTTDAYTGRPHFIPRVKGNAINSALIIYVEFAIFGINLMRYIPEVNEPIISPIAINMVDENRIFAVM